MLIRWRGMLAGLTTRGRCLLAAVTTLVLGSLLLGQRDLLRVGVFLVALPLVAVGLVARTRYRLGCARSLDPARTEAGATCTVQLRLDNVSRLPSGVLLMEDALPYALGGRPRFVLDRVEPRGVREVSYPVSSASRGRFVIGPLSVRLSDPFGLCELQRGFASSAELIVTPEVWPLPAIQLGGAWAGGGDGASRSIASSGSDDAATREYRHGDDLRRVHWKSTARVGELMVRREEQPFRSRATILLDARSGAHRGDGPGSSFEWAISAVASIGVALTRAGFTLSVLRDSGESLTPPGAVLTEGLLLEQLATLSPASGQALDPAGERLRRDGLAGVLLAVLGALDVPQAQRLARLRTGSRVCVAVTMDTDSWAPGSARTRAEATARLAQVEAVLAGAGWRVVPVTHGTSLSSVWPMARGRTARPLRSSPRPGASPGRERVHDHP